MMARLLAESVGEKEESWAEGHSEDWGSIGKQGALIEEPRERLCGPGYSVVRRTRDLARC